MITSREKEIYIGKVLIQGQVAEEAYLTVFID